MTAKPKPAWTPDIGATLTAPDTVRFKVWAPMADAMSVNIVTAAAVNTTTINAATVNADTDAAPVSHPLSPTPQGYWEGTVAAVPTHSRYTYTINRTLARPDPASRFQPDGVHGPSMVMDPATFAWTDRAWLGLPLEQLIIYELHVGTFTPDGTFDAVIGKLPYLRETVGVTAIELMPVAHCPGTRNWGYDGAFLFAPQANYGTPDDLKRLVDACHAHGLAVIMDVVYNHLGPEGNYLGDYGPYFTSRYQTPWGEAVNYDGPHSDAVRAFIIDNALYWVTEFHVDALRLDAIHGIFDGSATHILQELGEAVRAQAARCGRQIHVIAESDLHDTRAVTPVVRGGHGLSSQWNDNVHHALHALLTGERHGYYRDFGGLEHLAAAVAERGVDDGRPATAVTKRGVDDGRDAANDAAAAPFVVFAQNHDQVGNRARGDRLSTLVSFEALKLAAATVLLSPHIPLVFMGEEYGETAPFLYFIDHGDPDLIEAVRRGRMADVTTMTPPVDTKTMATSTTGDRDRHDVPDPHDPSTFAQSTLRWDATATAERTALLRWYHMLIDCRQSVPALGPGVATDILDVRADTATGVLTIHRTGRSGPAAYMMLNLNNQPTRVAWRQPEGRWALRLDADAPTFGGTQTRPAPPHLTAPRDDLQLPPYAVWVYTASSGK